MIKIAGMRQRITDPKATLIINTCSNSTVNWQSDLSPFLLGPCPLYHGMTAITMENGWQYAKLYEKHAYPDKKPTHDYWRWAQQGFDKLTADRYPMGRGARPLGSLWDGELLDYISARKKIYVRLYARAVVRTEGFRQLIEHYNQQTANGNNLWLRDWDGYDHDAAGLTLTEVLNNPRKKMGHAFVLKMLLTNDPAFYQCDTDIMIYDDDPAKISPRGRICWIDDEGYPRSIDR